MKFELHDHSKDVSLLCEMSMYSLVEGGYLQSDEAVDRVLAMRVGDEQLADGDQDSGAFYIRRVK